MKTTKIALFSLALLLGLNACTQEAKKAEPAAPETNKVQAYISSNTTDVLMKPGKNDSVIVSCGEGVFTSDEKKFPVVIGRRDTKDTASVTLYIYDEKEAFEYDEVIAFAAGQQYDTMYVATTLEFGQSADLVVSVPDKFATAYGTQELTIEVKVDYTWLPAGSVTMTSQWEGTTASVAIEKAKEYTDEAGNGLYHLVSPYYFLAPDYCTEEGYHLPFLLDSNYNAVELYGGPYIQVENTNYPYLIWHESYIKAGYDWFDNSVNNYSMQVVWADPTGAAYSYCIESFVWDKGYPGELIDPAEGDGELDAITFVAAEYEQLTDEDDYPITVDEIVDELLYSTDKYAFPDSYIEHYLYGVTLTSASGNMYLEVVGDALVGDYKFGAITANAWENYNGVAGTVVKGEWNGASIDGSYFQSALSTYYLVEGSVSITATGVTIDAKSASGAAIKGSFTGTVQEKGEAPAKHAKKFFGKL